MCVDIKACLHGKHVEVIGQDVVLCFRKQESQARCFHDLTRRSEDRGFREAPQLTADDSLCCSPRANKSKRQLYFLFFLSFRQMDRIVGFSLF